MRIFRVWLMAMVLSLVFSVMAQAPEADRDLDADLKQLETVPDWVETTKVDYDLSKPWKDARLEVRRLLGENKLREGMKLTWLYKQKDDIGNGHEWPMYLFIGGEYAWCVKASNEFIPRIEKEKDSFPTIAYLQLAACYVWYGEFEKAETTLKRGFQHLPPKPWVEMREADLHEALGKLYTRQDRFAEAKEEFNTAIEALKKARPPYGRHLIPMKIDKISALRDMVEMETFDLADIRNGVYSASMPAYAKPLKVQVQVVDGKIVDLKVYHQDKIELNSTKIVPQRIMEAQSLKVDGVTGATVTSDAIKAAAFNALKNAPKK